MKTRYVSALSFSLTGGNMLRFGDGDDTIASGPTYFAFSIDAGAGNDSIMTSYGDDMVFGGAGNDYLFSPGGNDYLAGGEGHDTVVYAGHWWATLAGGPGNDYIADFGGHASISGDEGDDVLVGTGRDYFVGGGGHDLFQVMSNGAPIDVSIFDGDLEWGDRVDLSKLGWWDEFGSFHAVTAADLELRGDDLIVHTEFYGDAVIHGVGEEIALVGISGTILFDNGMTGKG